MEEASYCCLLDGGIECVRIRVSFMHVGQGEGHSLLREGLQLMFHLYIPTSGKTIYLQVWNQELAGSHFFPSPFQGMGL